MAKTTNLNVNVTLNNPGDIKNLADALEGLVKALRPFAGVPVLLEPITDEAAGILEGFKVGDRVRMTGGRFAGKEGVITSLDFHEYETDVFRNSDHYQPFEVELANGRPGTWPHFKDVEKL
jgi:hypothetical protein